MIGVFDSGSGGLTVLRAIRDILPSADIVYFGDIAHAPYGHKSREELTELTLGAIRLLRNEGATTVVSACNSVSASMVVSLFDVFDLDIQQLIEMVGPTVASFRGTPNRLLVCATPATVLSGMYQHAFKMIGKDVVMCPLPNLAGLIESGAPQEVIDHDIREALNAYAPDTYDTVLLCCTHYPLVRDSFVRACGTRVEVVDPAHAVAERVMRYAWPREVGNGALSFIISKESETFRSYVESLFGGEPYSIEVRSL